MEPASELPIERSPSPPPHAAPESDPSVDELAAEGGSDAGGDGMLLSDDDGVREAGVAHASDGEDVVPVADAPDGEDVVPVADAPDGEDVVSVADAPDGEDVVSVADASDAEDVVPVADAASPVDNEDAETPPPVVKRKRGRPRKVPVIEKIETEEDDAVEDDDSPPPPVVADSSGKRRRGRPRKNPVAAKAPVVKKGKGEEAVCFVCFDGGDLVICDKRGCTKVYHADCVQKDESYFRTRGRWNCGWHICSHCEKAAHYMCYTCTYSLCKACNKGSGFVCVRGNKGFCGTCYQTVMSIEANEHTDGEKAEADLSGQTSWDYLFKIYWSGLKGKLSLTFDELSAANNRRKRPGGVTYNEDSSDESYHANDDQESGSDVSDDNEGKGSSRKKVRRRSRNTVSEERSVKQVDLGTNAEDDTKWASSELLEFVSHMKDGDTSSLSHFEVQDLILEYIKKNNLRDQRKKSQIICDSMLRKLFHKERVAHFEMLKLLESHFLMKEASQVIIDNNQGANLALDSGQMDAEGYHDAMTKFTFDKRRKSRKRLEEKEPQTNIDDYAAIDVHNIKLMYLRRSLMEDLLDELDTFNEKVTGTFVRIRISGENKKQEIYRLVQVVGTHETGEEYKLGKKTTHIRLNIQNLDKAEVVPMDILSNQEFTEDECRRLRQSIKCRVINPLTVGQVQDKAMVLQALRVDEWLESEKLRLGHLRDRASEKGRRKELRECVEKLQLLNKPEERLRMLNDIPEIHDDPKMDPDYESADEEPEHTQENSRKSSQPFYPRKGRNFASGKVDSPHFNGARRASNNIWEVKKSVPVEDARFEVNSFSNVGDKESMLSPAQGKGWSNNQHGGIPDQLNDISLETIYSPVSNAPSGPPITSETEVMWHYKDPALKIQGPFSLSQLRKWNIGGYFPPDMTIWRMCDKRNDQYLLTDALNGKFQKTLLPVEPQSSGLPQPIATATPTPTPWLDNNQNHGNRNVVPNNTAFPASNIQVGSVPMVWSAPQIVIPRPIQGRIGPSGWETSSNVNILPGQVQTHMNYVPPVQPPINYGPTVPPVQANINFIPAVPQLQTNVNFMPPMQPHFVPPVPFSGNNYRPPPFPGRGGRGGNAGRWNRVQDVGTPWNSNMSGGQRPNAQGYDRRPPWNPSVQQSSGEALFPRPAIDSNNQWGNNMFNPPTPTPQLTGSGFPGGQGTPNMLHKTTPEIMKSNEEAAGNSAWGSWSASAPDNTKKGDGWNSWSAISSALPDKTNTTEKADGPDSWSPVSSTLPYKKTTSGSVTAASTSNENQFFQGECPSPTPLCERQELDDKDLQASFTEDTTDKDKSISEAKKDLAPILVADDKTNDDVWSLPSPTPSTNPAALNQGWASGDTKVQATVWDQAVQNLETTDGGKSSGWGEWEKSTAQGPSAQTSTNPNRGLGFAPGSTNISAGGAPPVSGSAAGGKGWGPPLPGGTNQSFGSFVPAVGNTPNPGWGAPPQNPNWVAGPMRGGPPRPPPRGQGPTGVCKFHERGFCRKGSACQYRHV